MPNILFASNSVSHFPGAVIGAPAWSFDSNRVPYSLEVVPALKVSSPVIPQPAGDEWWFHFRAGSEDFHVNNNEQICEVTNEAGDEIFRMTFHDRISTEGFHFYLNADGSSYFNTRQNVPWGNNQLRTIDIQYLFTGVNLVVRFYVNELLLHTFDVPVASFLRPARLLLGGFIGTNSETTGKAYYSEIIVADGDTRNSRLDLLRPTAVGVYGNWDGPVVSLSDDDPTTGMTTTLPNQNQSTILTPYTGANNISNIVQVTTTVRGINAPTQLEHLIRMSGVDYLTGTPYTVPFEKDYQITDWAENPATSLPWAATDLVNIEFGFRSLA
ncbi:virion protein [Roseobacter phage RD-1410Ws-07]|uniref:Virion protein n=2 Tax=Sanyabayvirus DS1410Ws06 TaxID=2844087 RepID=A0A191VYU6_9CAUD|nr:virion protein [Dinoroseobacter phage DS-1410Ws-06]ANJ20733.1 virion protein [Dinoroseobacter phage DS-1410Ws-06]ANJ20884.1 virion protein [Roseobacter phage RD-1410Ws-07]